MTPCSSDATLNVTQYLVNQLAYTGHLTEYRAENIYSEKYSEKGKLSFTTAFEKNWSHVEYIGKMLGVRRAYNKHQSEVWEALLDPI